MRRAVILLTGLLVAGTLTTDSPAKAANQLSPHATVTNDGEMYDVSGAPGGLPFGLVEGSDGDSEDVQGEDTRRQVTDTTVSPFKRIVKISSSLGGCTGWMIGAHHVATAGHCVFNRDTDVWATNVTVRPGQDGTERPFGTCGARKLYSVLGWTWFGNRDYDYGAIKLDCEIGSTIGWFGWFWQSASFNGERITVTGYPGDKPPGTMWTASGTVQSSETMRLFYQVDTENGESGGPVYQNRSPDAPYCQYWCAIAIHTTGNSTENGSTRITKEVNDNLRSWRTEA